MNILLVSVVFPPAWRYGGPPRSAHIMAKAMIQQGHSVFALCTGDRETDGSPILDEDTVWDGVPVRYCSRKRRLIPYYSPSLQQQVASRVVAYDVVIIQSSWTYVGPAASRECFRKGVPYLAYPRGCFDVWCMRRGRLKKAVFWHLLDKLYFQRASVIVALTKSEAENVRRMGLNNRVEVIPNGVNVDDFLGGSTREELEVQFPKIKGRPIVLFMGRIHPIKGLPNLIVALKQVHPCHPEVLLVIAGPDEGGHRREIEQCVRQQGLMDHVLFTGPVDGMMKVGLLKNAEAFVLPSYSEGFSVALLEALACKLPVVLTKNCHVPEVAEAGAGIEVEPSPREIASALNTLLADDLVRIQMGENGYRLATGRFSWEQVTRMTVAICSEVAR